jgi:peptidoglycan/xylan/chitin deacetylase (PgdA/CDA1 family)
VTTPDTPAACLTFDFDAMSVWIGTYGFHGPSAISRGEFGARVGLTRILTLLDREAVPATFFVPGHTVETYPELCCEIVARGHEIGHHGYLHERPVDLNSAKERAALERGLEVLERILETRPLGYRAPGWEHSDDTIGLLLEHGFAYDSSMMAQDYEPYFCRQGDVVQLDGPFLFGSEVELVELPVSWSLDDMPQLEFMKAPLDPVPGLSGYDKTLSMWSTDFDYMVEHVPGGVLTTTMHPEVIGRAGRMRILEGLIAHMKRGNATFLRGTEAIERWRRDSPTRTTGTFTEPRH